MPIATPLESPALALILSWLCLPLAAWGLWAHWFAQRAEFASRAGGWAFVGLLLTSCLAVLALIGAPSWLATGLLTLAVLMGLLTPRPKLPVAERLAPLLISVLPPLMLWGSTLWLAPARLASGGQQSFWQDWFFHGVLIDMLANSHNLPAHDLRAIDLPVMPYHYLGYGLPAWLAARTGASGLTLAWWIWAPMGFLLLTAAATEWVRRLRPTAPWLSVILPISLFLPDAAQLGSGQAFLGWHWLATISPGTLYGASAMLLITSWLYNRIGNITGNASSWPTAAPLVITLTITAFLKAQIVLLAGPLLILWWVLNIRAPIQRRIALILIAAIGSIILLGPPLPALPLLHLGGGGWREYWPALLRLQSPGWLDAWTANPLAPATILIGTMGWTLLGAIAWRRAPPPLRWLLILIPAGYLLFALGLDLDHRGGAGTPEELQHRPLVWVLPAWWLTAAPLLLSERNLAKIEAKVAALALLSIVTAACLAGFRWGPTVQNGPSALAATAFVPVGRVQAATYIRSHRSERDVCQDADADPTFQWAAISGCPPWWIDFNSHARSSQSVLTRAAAWQELRVLPPAERLARLRRLGVTWYSAGPRDAGTMVALPANAGLPVPPAFQSDDGYVIYQIKP
jgi:hypothetical protein